MREGKKRLLPLFFCRGLLRRARAALPRSIDGPARGPAGRAPRPPKSAATGGRKAAAAARGDGERGAAVEREERERGTRTPLSLSFSLRAAPGLTERRRPSATRSTTEVSIWRTSIGEAGADCSALYVAFGWRTKGRLEGGGGGGSAPGAAPLLVAAAADADMDDGWTSVTGGRVDLCPVCVLGGGSAEARERKSGGVCERKRTRSGRWFLPAVARRRRRRSIRGGRERESADGGEGG